jgi:hypothetical protein
MPFPRHFVKIAFSWGLFVAISGSLWAQKNDLKTTPPPSSKTGGKEALRAGKPTPQDTLRGGNGFVPRTVIDSFPSQPASLKQIKPQTALTQSRIDSARSRILDIERQIALGDSVLTSLKTQKSLDGGEESAKTLEKDLLKAKKELQQAKKRLSDLQATYNEQAVKTQPPQSSTPPKETKPSQEKAGIKTQKP